jgi:hypothetical protein
MKKDSERQRERETVKDIVGDRERKSNCLNYIFY